jgi:Flp pilus assembly protein CpaB
VTIGVRTGAGGAPRSPALAVMSADGERDLAVDIPSLVGARRFVLPKERTNILFYARKPFGAPLEQWDLLNFPVCHAHIMLTSRWTL